MKGLWWWNSVTRCSANCVSTKRNRWEWWVWIILELFPSFCVDCAKSNRERKTIHCWDFLLLFSQRGVLVRRKINGESNWKTVRGKSHCGARDKPRNFPFCYRERFANVFVIEKDVVNGASFEISISLRRRRSFVFSTSTHREILLMTHKFCIFFLFFLPAHKKKQILSRNINTNFCRELKKKVPNIGDYSNESGEDKMPLVTIFVEKKTPKKNQIISHKNVFYAFKTRKPFFFSL